jgi:hypothetical protein
VVAWQCDHWTQLVLSQLVLLLLLLLLLLLQLAQCWSQQLACDVLHMLMLQFACRMSSPAGSILLCHDAC